MLEFYKRHPQLTALVLVTGMKKTDNGDLVRQSAISRMNLLEKTKAGFESIISESIWSLCRDSSVDVSKLLDTTWPGKYEKPVVSYASRLRIVSDRAIEAVKNADKCPNLFWSGYVIPSFSTVVDQPVGSSSGIRHGQHSLMDAFANVIKYNEKLVKMEAEKENDQDTLKRPNAGDVSLLIILVFYIHFRIQIPIRLRRRQRSRFRTRRVSLKRRLSLRSSRKRDCIARCQLFMQQETVLDTLYMSSLTSRSLIEE